MKNILFVLPTSTLGGAERVAQNIVDFLCKDSDTNVTVVFLTQSENHWTTLSKYKNLTFVSINSTRELRSIPKLIYYLFSKKYNTVFTTHIHINGLMSLMRYCKVLTTDLLIMRDSTVAADRFFGFKRKIFDLIYMLYGAQDLLISQTDYMHQRLIEEYPKFKNQNLVTLDNPLNLNLINEYLNENLETLKSNNRFRIVIVGRLVDVKNHKLLISAIAKLPDNQKVNFLIQVVGDGPKSTELKTLVQELGLTNTIEFVGRQTNPYQYMKDADVGISTSLSEGFPNVLIEMMYCGVKNIISTPSSPGLSVLENIEILPDFTSLALRDALLHSYTLPKDHSTSYYSQAINRDVKNYWNRIVRFTDET